MEEGRTSLAEAEKMFFTTKDNNPLTPLLFSLSGVVKDSHKTAWSICFNSALENKIMNKKKKKNKEKKRKKKKMKNTSSFQYNSLTTSQPPIENGEDEKDE